MNLSAQKNEPDVLETELRHDLNSVDSVIHLAPISMMQSESTTKKYCIKKF